MTDTPESQIPSTRPPHEGIWEILRDMARRLIKALIAVVQKLLELVKGHLIATFFWLVILGVLLVALAQCGGPSNDSAASTSTDVPTTVVSTTEPSTTLAPATTVEETTTTSTSAVPVVPSGSVVQTPPTTEKKIATTTTVAKKKTTTTVAPATTAAPTTTTAPTTTVAPTTTPAPTTTTTTLPPTTTTTTPSREVIFSFVNGSWTDSEKTQSVVDISTLDPMDRTTWVGSLPGTSSTFGFKLFQYKTQMFYMPVQYQAVGATCTDDAIQDASVVERVRPLSSDPERYLNVSCTATGSGPITVELVYPSHS